MGGQEGSWVPLIIYFGVFVLIFYLLIVLPRKKQEKKHDVLLSELKRGDKVISIGGIRGEVAKVKEETIVVKVSNEVEIEFVKKAIGSRVGDE